MRLSAVYVAAIIVIAATSCSRAGDTQAGIAERRIAALLREIPAHVGVCAETEDGRRIEYRAEEAFPMLSTFKVPVAIAAIRRMEATGADFTLSVDVAAEAMRPDTYSPLRDRHPEGGFRSTLDELLAYTISYSDNNACDILIGYAGGTGSIARSMEEAGMGPMTIAATEEEMHRTTDNQRINVCTPRAAAHLLKRLSKGELLSETNTEALIGHMIRTETGPDKLRAGVPQHITVAHKTGSSDRTPQGVKIADNDMGIVMLPDGRRYAIAVFVSDSHLDDKGNAALIAAVSRIVYETFAKPPKGE